jgi:Ca-activated chloride channel family protein
MARLVNAFVIILLTTAVATAQSGSTVFRTGVEIVALNVSVTDASGAPVQGLSEGDFAVLEDDVPQDVSFFAAVPAPIDLALLLDTSASMADKIASVQEAALGFTESMRPEDRVTVVDIKDTLRVLHPLNSDGAGARQAIARLTASGNTALYNGLYLTLRQLTTHRSVNGEVRRQAIVVLSDGDDTSSLVAFDDVMELVKRSGVAVYTITLRSPLEEQRLLVRSRASSAAAEYSMRVLAQETGARAFFPAAITELAGVYSTIADELARQYSIGYSPTNARLDGTYRRITVHVERPGVRTRTRAGYMAAAGSLATR